MSFKSRCAGVDAATSDVAGVVMVVVASVFRLMLVVDAVDSCIQGVPCCALAETADMPGPPEISPVMLWSPPPAPLLAVAEAKLRWRSPQRLSSIRSASLVCESLGLVAGPRDEYHACRS